MGSASVEPVTIEVRRGDDGLVDRVIEEMLRGRSEKQFGRYDLLGRLGSGGAGVVYRARDHALGRDVALKLIKPGGVGPDARRNAESRLLKEGQALARLSHPNIVEVFDLGRWNAKVVGDATPTHTDGFFVVMEVVDGLDLHRWLRQGTPTRAAILDVFVQAGRGLAAAHRAGLVHRDFKPGNVLVDRGQPARARVADFGIAAMFGGVALGHEDPPTDSDTRSSASRADGSVPTPAAYVVGTWLYMAPEQQSAAKADPRADQYAYCVSLFEAVCGHRPFADQSPRSLLQAKLDEQYAIDASLPPRLRSVLRRGLRPAPDDRFPSMDALLDALTGRRAQRRRRRAISATAAGLSVAAVAWIATVERVDPHAACAAETTRLQDAWTPDRLQEIHDALVRTGSPAAERAFSLASARIDAFAGAWTEQRDAVCVDLARMVVGDDTIVDRRRECLAAHHRDANAALSVLATVDRKGVNAIGPTLDGFEGVQRCRDDAWLSRVTAAPTDPELAIEVAHIRRDLATALALRRAGRLEDANAIVDDAYDRARAVAYAPVALEAAELRANLLCDAERFDLGVPALEAVALEAETIGHLETAIDAATRLSFLLVGVVGDGEAGERWARQAQALLLRDPDPLCEAELLGVRSDIARASGDVEGMVVRQRESYDRFTSVLGRGHEDTARSSLSLAFVLAEVGEHDEAVALSSAGLLVIESIYGPSHPEVAGALINAGAVADMTGDRGLALQRFRAAHEIFADAMGPDHAASLAVAENYGALLADMGHFDEAITLLRKAAVGIERVAGPDSPSTAALLTQLGLALAKASQGEEALLRLRRAATIHERSGGPRHPALGFTYVGIGLAYASLQQHDRALEAFQTAEQTDMPLDAWCEIGRVGSLLALGRIDDADVAATRIAAECEQGRCLGDTAKHLARFALAQTRHAIGERSAAIEHARAAAEGLASAPGDMTPWTVAIEIWLARHSGA